MKRLVAGVVIVLFGSGVAAVAWFYLAPPEQVLRVIVTMQRAYAGLEANEVG